MLGNSKTSVSSVSFVVEVRVEVAVTGIGLAFSVQETPAIPALSHDVALDFVLTERDVFDFRSK